MTHNTEAPTLQGLLDAIRKFPKPQPVQPIELTQAELDAIPKADSGVSTIGAMLFGVPVRIVEQHEPKHELMTRYLVESYRFPEWMTKSAVSIQGEF